MACTTNRATNLVRISPPYGFLSSAMELAIHTEGQYILTDSARVKGKIFHILS
jgi:hypothetical protein